MNLTRQFWENQIGIGWCRILKDTLRSEYMTRLMTFLKMEYSIHDIIPVKEHVFKSFKLCPFESLKIVIIGPSPIITQSSGLLCGSTSTNTFLSDDLYNIRNGIEKDYGLQIDFDTTLESWAKQGILMLNLSNTIRKDESLNHTKQWNKFITSAIRNINDTAPGTIFLFLGKQGLQFMPLISNNHDILFTNITEDTDSFVNDVRKYSFKQINNLIESKYGAENCIKW